jgi:hypothetical protein
MRLALNLVRFIWILEEESVVKQSLATEEVHFSESFLATAIFSPKNTYEFIWIEIVQM